MACKDPFQPQLYMNSTNLTWTLFVSFQTFPSYSRKRGLFDPGVCGFHQGWKATSTKSRLKIPPITPNQTKQTSTRLIALWIGVLFAVIWHCITSKKNGQNAHVWAKIGAKKEINFPREPLKLSRWSRCPQKDRDQGYPIPGKNLDYLDFYDPKKVKPYFHLKTLVFKPKLSVVNSNRTKAQ